MKWKMLKNDLRLNRTISLILLLFILISSLLVSGAAIIIGSLQSSVDNLFEKADAPHFLQMHAGEIDQEKIDVFAQSNPLVSKQQTIPMLNIDGSNLFLGDEAISMSGSTIDIGFVTQSPKFDYLLDLENKIIAVKNGEISVPIYYMQKYGLSVGDRLVVRDGTFSKVFTVTSFLRDSQMNSTLASSKRLVVSEADLAELMAHTGKVEYLIEFQLTDVKRVSEFEAAYQAANLPTQGPAVGYSMLRMINIISDGMTAAVIILAGLLLVLIAMLCLRFTILSTLEEDMREIGVMKAIGISHKDIKQLYMTKYLMFAGGGCVLGYLASLLIGDMFTKNITLYMGAPEKTAWTVILPLLASGTVFLLVVLYCRKTVNFLRKISAVEAMYPVRVSVRKKQRWYLILKDRKRMECNSYLALQDLIVRPHTFSLLLLLFVVCVFLILVPVNLLNTLQSSTFIEYMGAARSDVRMDLQQHDNLKEQLAEISSALTGDLRVQKSAVFAAYKCKLQSPDGTILSLNVETGNFETFPITFLEGKAPVKHGEIALSYLWAKELNFKIGEVLELILPDNTTVSLRLCGIYQDITNGGKTAKAFLPDMDVQPFRGHVNLNVVDQKYIAAVCEDYKSAFPSAKVTNIQSFLEQTYGGMIEQTRFVVLLALIVSASMFLLIVSLFLKLLLAKDTAQNAVLMSIGFSRKDVRWQYWRRIFVLLFAGVIIGTAAANTLGQWLVSTLLSRMGVPKLEFVIEPLQVCLLIPLLLLLVTAIAVWTGTKSIKSVSISTLNAE